MHGLAAIPPTEGQTDRILEFNASLLGRGTNIKFISPVVTINEFRIFDYKPTKQRDKFIITEWLI
jgi:hypothetical protein